MFCDCSDTLTIAGGVASTQCFLVSNPIGMVFYIELLNKTAGPKFPRQFPVLRCLFFKRDSILRLPFVLYGLSKTRTYERGEHRKHERIRGRMHATRSHQRRGSSFLYEDLLVRRCLFAHTQRSFKDANSLTTCNLCTLPPPPKKQLSS